MSNSFIEFKEKGFWANDAFVEAIQICLINEIELTETNEESWLTDFKNELALQSYPMVYGGMSLGLDEFLIEEARIETLTNLIDKVCTKINETDYYLTGNTLHEFRKRAMQIIDDTEQLDFKSRHEFEEAVNYSNWNTSEIHEVKDRYLHGFLLLKRLIQGKLDSNVSSLEDYWNF